MIPHDVVVHVGGPGRDCAPGIVLVAGQVSRIRVLRSSGLGQAPIGATDEEGDICNWRDTIYVPTPAEHGDHPHDSYSSRGVFQGLWWGYEGCPGCHPAFRALDTWHYTHECLSPIPYPEAPNAHVRG